MWIGWQVVCARHTHGGAKCTRTRNLGVKVGANDAERAAASEAVLRLLQYWVARTPPPESMEDHMGLDPDGDPPMDVIPDGDDLETLGLHMFAATSSSSSDAAAASAPDPAASAPVAAHGGRRGRGRGRAGRGRRGAGKGAGRGAGRGEAHVVVDESPVSLADEMASHSTSSNSSASNSSSSRKGSKSSSSSSSGD